MTMVRGRPAGPDGAGGAFQNDVESERTGWWHSLGGEQAVIEGFAHAGVAGQMALDFTPGAALVGERAADGTASLDRGYLVWADSTTRVTFAPASAAARNDAVIACFVDTEDGALGTGVTQVGPQIIVVTGVSGTTTPRTDAQINTALGRGGWIRLMDVPIASTDTQINVANIAKTVASYLSEWHTVGAAGEPAFTNGYAAGSTPVQFTKRNGITYIRGNIIAGTNAASAFTLPTTYRPKPGPWYQAVSGWSNGTGNVIVNTDGTVAIEYISGGSPPRYNLGVAFPTW